MGLWCFVIFGKLGARKLWEIEGIGEIDERGNWERGGMWGTHSFLFSPPFDTTSYSSSYGGHRRVCGCTYYDCLIHSWKIPSALLHVTQKPYVIRSSCIN